MMARRFNVALLALCLWASQAPTMVQSSKILAVYAFPGKSHFMMSDALIKELIDRNHQVTLITAYTMSQYKLGSNYTEILIDPVYNFWGDVKDVFSADNLFEMTSMSMFDFMEMLKIIGTKVTEHALKQPKVQEIINAQQTEAVFDLLLLEQFYQEPFHALAHKYNIPVVTTSTLGYTNHMSQMMGLISPWSFVPHGFMPFTDHMTFWERVQNTFYSLYEDLHREYVYFPKMDELVDKYFRHLPVRIPKVTEMEKNISLILLNSYSPLTTARPTIDGLISVGGLHIYPPKTLPAGIKRFLDEAEHGVIYFSLGSNVQSKDMPIEKLKMFLEVFSGLKQRVLWKFENESIKDLPANVMIKKWMPQPDILAHRNIKVFITHGGLFGTQESVHNGVPMLGMPIYCDQHLNLNKAVLGGYAISLQFHSITKEILKDAITSLLEDPSYRRNIQRVSEIFRDRPMSARDTAMYWIEYIIRHKGATHLRSAGLDLKWYQFYLLDVIAFIGGIILFGVLVLVILLRLLCNRGSGTKKVKMH